MRELRGNKSCTSSLYTIFTALKGIQAREWTMGVGQILFLVQTLANGGAYKVLNRICILRDLQ